MKAKLLTLCLLALVACGKDEPQDTTPKTIDDGPEVEITTYHFIPDKATDQVYPRMGFETENWFVLEMAYPEFATQKVDIFNFMDIKNRRRFMVTMSDDGIAMAEYNPVEGRIGNDVLTVNLTGNTLKVAGFRHSEWQEDTTVIGIAERTVSLQSKALTKAEIETTIRKTFYDLFSQIGDDISFMSNFLFDGSAKTYCEAWKNIIVPIAQYNLYEDDPAMLEEMLKHKEQDKWGNYIMNKIWGDDLYAAISTFGDAWRKGGELADAMYSNEESAKCLNLQPGASSQLQPYVKKAKTTVREYKVELKQVSKDASSAVFRVETTQLVSDASRLNHGYIYYGQTGVSLRQGPYFTSFPAEVTISGLQPGKDYTVVAYVYTEDGMVYTDGTEIHTPTDLALSPESLTIPADGGENAFGVIVPDTDWTWKITSQPGWCTVTGIGKQSFFFKAGATNTEREGTFVIEATNGRETRQVEGFVRQTGSQWDGTAWEGNVTTVVNATGPDAERVQYGLGLDYVQVQIFNAMAGEFRSNFSWNSMRSSGKVLTFTHSESRSVSTEDGVSATLRETASMTMVRVDDKTASITVSGTIVVSGGASANVTITGSGTAHRVM